MSMKKSNIIAINNLVKDLIENHDSVLDVWQDEPFQSRLFAILTPTKKATDPLRPKKPMNTYMLFSADERANLKVANPELNGSASMKRLAEMWNQLNEDATATTKAGKAAAARIMAYASTVDLAKRKYVTEMAVYAPDEKVGRTPTPSDKPKGAKSAYMFFTASDRESLKKDHPDLTANEFSSKISEVWKSLQASKKPTDVKQLAKFTQLALDDKARLATEMHVWMAAHPEHIPLDFYTKWVTRERAIHLAADKKQDKKQLTTTLRAEWAAMSDDEKRAAVEESEESE